jgi:hypothetical protein
MSFEAPVFTFWGVLYTGIGSAVYWNWQGKKKIEAFSLSKTWRMLPLSKQVRSLIEFLVFIVLGVLVGIAFTQPQNPRQALTAGFAWTSVFGSIKGRQQRRQNV